MITKMDIFFQFLYLFMNILSPVSHLRRFMMVLSNHNEIQRASNFCGNIYLPFTRFLYRMFLTRNSYLSTDFQKNLMHILRQTKCSVVPRKDFI